MKREIKELLEVVMTEFCRNNDNLTNGQRVALIELADYYLENYKLENIEVRHADLEVLEDA